MAFLSRTITGFVWDSGGRPVINGVIKIQPTVKVSNTQSHVVVDRAYYSKTSAAGYFEFSVACSDNGLTALLYKVTYPSMDGGEPDDAYHRTISVAYGSGGSIEIGAATLPGESATNIIDNATLRGVIQQEIASSGSGNSPTTPGNFSTFTYPNSITSIKAMTAAPDGDEIVGLLKAILQTLGASGT